jgi:RNA polymerase sigma factor (sigma-70 family)
MASRLTTCSADADDVMQDALMVAWTRRAAIPPEPWPWFCRVITNCARNHQRKNARVRPMPYIDHESGAEAPPEHKLQADELRAAIYAAMGELSPEEHEAVALCVLGGLTQAEAANAVGVSINTIKARVRRGTERLREKFKRRPEAIEAFLALPALPHPSGGLEAAAARWIAAAKKGGPWSWLPLLTPVQLALAVLVLAGLSAAAVTFTLMQPPGGNTPGKVAALEAPAPLDGPAESAPELGTGRDGDRPVAPRAGSFTGSAPDTLPVSPDADPRTETPPPAPGETLIPISDTYPSGQLRSEGAYIKAPDGNHVHGHWKYYYSDGTLQDEGAYIRGARQGTWKKYHRNTELASIGPYVDDERHGLWEFFREDGSLLVRGEYDRGKRSGTWTASFAEGEVSQTTTWHHGKRNGWRRRYDRSGRLLAETDYVRDMRNGRHIEYDPVSGRPRLETNYFNDMKHGIEVIYDPATGRVTGTALYHLDQRRDP